MFVSEHVVMGPSAGSLGRPDNPRQFVMPGLTPVTIRTLSFSNIAIPPKSQMRLIVGQIKISGIKRGGNNAPKDFRGRHVVGDDRRPAG